MTSERTVESCSRNVVAEMSLEEEEGHGRESIISNENSTALGDVI